MIQKRLKDDLAKLLNSPMVASLTKRLDFYEARVQQVLRELDLRSQEARRKSRKQVEKFAGQLGKARVEVEKRVGEVLEREAKKLNNRAMDLVTYLKAVALTEDDKIKPEVKSTTKKRPSNKSARRKNR